MNGDTLFDRIAGFILGFPLAFGMVVGAALAMVLWVLFT